MDPLGILGARGVCAADLVVAALRPRDAQAADIIAAQAAWLRDGSEASRAAAAARVHAVTDTTNLAAWRSQLYLGDLFDDNLTRLGPGDADLVWVFDDDIVTLEDCGLWDPATQPSPWDANTGAAAALGALLASDARAGVLGVRLLVFEGTARLAAAVRDHGAADLVSHLELRLQRARDEGPVARAFPALQGLCCEGRDLTALMAEELPSLRSLVVRGAVEPRILLHCLDRAPALCHLGVHYMRWSEDDLATLLGSPRLGRLRGLELHDVNGATDFPFDAFLAARDTWGHLGFVGLPGHLVSREVRAAFAGHPQVTFVGHDRREVIAVDFDTIGWGETAR